MAVTSASAVMADVVMLNVLHGGAYNNGDACNIYAYQGAFGQMLLRSSMQTLL